jgi:hypothetical protein
LIFNLLENLDVLGNRLSRLVSQPGHALAVRRLAPWLAFGYALHELTYVEASSLECRGLCRGLALAVGAVARAHFVL